MLASREGEYEKMISAFASLDIAVCKKESMNAEIIFDILDDFLLDKSVSKALVLKAYLHTLRIFPCIEREGYLDFFITEFTRGSTLEIQRMALNCLVSYVIVQKTKMGFVFDEIFKQVKECLVQYRPSHTDMSRFVSACLRGLNLLLEQDFTLLSSSSFPKELYIKILILLTRVENDDFGHYKDMIWTFKKDSHSQCKEEYSQKYFTKMILTVLNCLCLLARNLPSLIHSQWLDLFPIGGGCGILKLNSLSDCTSRMLNNFLHILFSQSKLFFSAARNTSTFRFISWSEKIALSIENIAEMLMSRDDLTLSLLPLFKSISFSRLSRSFNLKVSEFIVSLRDDELRIQLFFVFCSSALKEFTVSTAKLLLNNEIFLNSLKDTVKSFPDLHESLLPQIIDAFKSDLQKWNYLKSCSEVLIEPNVWLKLLGMAETDIESTEDKLRSIIYECLSNITEAVYISMDEKKRTLFIFYAIASLGDICTRARCAGIRLIGVLVLFESLYKDPLFISDVIYMLESMKNDVDGTVQMKCSWALANVTDVLSLQKPSIDFPLCLYEIIADLTVKHVKECDKIRCNGMRCAGNFIFIIPSHMLGHFKQAIEFLLSSLAKNVENGPFKVRWNAAHAFLNVFKNEEFKEAYKSNEIFHTCIESLLSAFIRSKNFKVRINSGLALLSLNRKDFCVKGWSSFCSEINCMSLLSEQQELYVDHLNEIIVQCKIKASK